MKDDPACTPPLFSVVAAAPVRINDLGGWTDTWFAGEGRVLNLAAAPGTEVRIRVSENPGRDARRVRIHAANFGDTFTLVPEEPDLRTHPLLQAAVQAAGVPRDRKLEITVRSAVPAGSSLGTSASACVALLGALDRVHGKQSTPAEVAARAHRVETEGLGLQSGIQDQVCAAHGGICFIHMKHYPEARVERLALDSAVTAALEERLALVYLGGAHSSSALHEEVIARLERTGEGHPVLSELRDLAEAGRDALRAGDLPAYGRAMTLNTECQRRLHPGLVCRDADRVIETARRHGAAGWKVNGAGGEGGSLTLLGPEDEADRDAFRAAIETLDPGITLLPFTLDPEGLRIRTAPGNGSGPPPPAGRA